MIEKLVRGGFVERKKKLLVPTARGMELIKVLPESVKSAGLTAVSANLCFSGQTAHKSRAAVRERILRSPVGSSSRFTFATSFVGMMRENTGAFAGIKQGRDCGSKGSRAA